MSRIIEASILIRIHATTHTPYGAGGLLIGWPNRATLGETHEPRKDRIACVRRRRPIFESLDIRKGMARWEGNERHGARERGIYQARQFMH